MKHSDKQKAEFARRRRVKAALLEKCPVDKLGRKICPTCQKLPDFRGLSLMHIKALARGGRTSMENCVLRCFSCHNGPQGHRTENMPKSKAVDRPPMPVMGFTGLHPYSVETQVGRKKK